MDIRILGGNGLHASEVRAVKRMQESLRQSWFGYASLLVVDDEGSMDVDTMIITHDRLLLVELKEWTGKLESGDGRWYLNGYSKGKVPMRSSVSTRFGLASFWEGSFNTSSAMRPESKPML